MKLNFTDFLFAMSFALDAVEKEVNGAKEGHGKRVTYLMCKMLKSEGYSNQEIVDYAACAILHDSGLAKTVRDEHEMLLSEDFIGLGYHATIGEKSVNLLPVSSDIHNIVLYHHENADGSGPFKKKEGETNLISEVIHLADTVDVMTDMKHMTPEEFKNICAFIKQNEGRFYSKRAVSLFETNIHWQDILEFQNGNLENDLHQMIPMVENHYSDTEIEQIAAFFATIVDYKSSFTKDHSLGVADRARVMAQHYGFDADKTIRFYFAGAMHDIGKLVVNNHILEKPGKLDPNEFRSMKDHATISYQLLRSIHGFEDIAEWAGNHHEKLDGTGYSRGLCDSQLSFEDRLMACIDIYQALIEERPYKKNLSHEKTIEIMREMAALNKIDRSIVDDIDDIFAPQHEYVQEIDDETNTIQWRCKVCGYVHEGPNPPMHCPICDGDSQSFERI